MRRSIDFSNINVASYKSFVWDQKAKITKQKKIIDTAYNNKSIPLDENLSMLKKIYPNKVLFTIEETATVLNVSYEFIRQRAANEKIPARSFGDRWMINILTLAELLTKGVK